MAEYHVGCGAFGIYAGTLNGRNKSIWQNKSDVTDEAIGAVTDYLVQECLGGFEWDMTDGRKLELRVTISEPVKKCYFV